MLSASLSESDGYILLCHPSYIVHRLLVLYFLETNLQAQLVNDCPAWQFAMYSVLLLNSFSQQTKGREGWSSCLSTQYCCLSACSVVTSLMPQPLA
jgi:hypothetical protein